MHHNNHGMHHNNHGMHHKNHHGTQTIQQSIALQNSEGTCNMRRTMINVAKGYNGSSPEEDLITRYYANDKVTHRCELDGESRANALYKICGYCLFVSVLPTFF
jgi:hypothetical protein